MVHHGTPRAQGQADKHLAQLAEAGKIASKENGKSKIYWADQSGVAELSAQELQQIDLESNSLKAERERLAQQVADTAFHGDDEDKGSYYPDTDSDDEYATLIAMGLLTKAEAKHIKRYPCIKAVVPIKAPIYLRMQS